MPARGCLRADPSHRSGPRRSAVAATRMPSARARAARARAEQQGCVVIMVRKCQGLRGTTWPCMLFFSRGNRARSGRGGRGRGWLVVQTCGVSFARQGGPPEFVAVPLPAQRCLYYSTPTSRRPDPPYSRPKIGLGVRSRDRNSALLWNPGL
eukprot:gene13356-biopygen1987